MSDMNDYLLEQYFYPMLAKADDNGSMQPNKGVQQSYKDVAGKSANVMFRAKIKGHKELDHGIPLHMTLKTFDKPEEMNADEVKSKAKELGVERPDPHNLKFEPVIFKAKKTGNTYYMLKIHGVDPSLKQFNDHFKGQGITHDEFMSHITINKELYDKIKKEGIHPNEIEFSPLMIEHGPNNPTHIFPDSHSHKDKNSDITPKKLNPVPQYGPTKLAASEDFSNDLQKGIIRNTAAGLVAAGMIASAVPAGNAAIDHAPKAGSHEIEPSASLSPKYDRGHMLRTIASVESSNGKDMNHKPMGGMHHGETAFGKYGLTPVTIRETIKMNRDLASKYKKAALLSGNDLKHYVEDHPGLEDQIAEKHLVRLEHHFGQDPGKIGYAWLNGVTGTYKANKEHKNLDDHWHVKKIREAYSKGPTTKISSR